MNLTAVLSYAVTSIFALEQAMPKGGLGSAKKKIVMGGISTLINAAAIEADTLSHGAFGVDTVPTKLGLVSIFVDETVGILNQAGVFKKTA